MKEAELKNIRQFPAGLKPQDRLLLEVLVTDENAEDALGFLADHGIGITEGDNPVQICKTWFRQIRKGERGKLQIRLTAKGPTMDINT